MWLILTVLSVGDLVTSGQVWATQDEVEEEVEKVWGNDSVINLKSGKSGVK